MFVPLKKKDFSPDWDPFNRLLNHIARASFISPTFSSRFLAVYISEVKSRRQTCPTLWSRCLFILPDPWDLKKSLFCLRKPADIENIDIKGHPTSWSMQSEAQCRRRVLLHVLASRTTRCGQQLASSSPRRWSVVEKNSCWCFLRRYNVSRDAIRNKCRRLAPFLLSVSPVVFSLSFIPCWLAGGGKTAPVLILALIHRKSRFKTIQSVHLSAIMPAHATKEQAQSSGKHQPIDSYLFADFPPEHLWWIDPHMVLSLFLTNWPKNGIGDLLAARILRLG